MRVSPERGYFVPACVGSGRWADFESCSRVRRVRLSVFWRKSSIWLTRNWGSTRYHHHWEADLFKHFVHLCLFFSVFRLLLLRCYFPLAHLHCELLCSWGCLSLALSPPSPLPLRWGRMGRIANARLATPTVTRGSDAI